MSILPLEELYKKSYEELLDYFDEILVGKDELNAILEELGYKPHSKSKLKEFVARQISETALFLHVATTRRGI